MSIFDISEEGARRSPVGGNQESCRHSGGLPVAGWLDARVEERRLRFEVFSPEVVNDQGWLILLVLYRAQLQDRAVTQEQVADAANLPATAVVRYVDHLAAHGLVQRDGTRSDGLVRLADHGRRELPYFSKFLEHQSPEGFN
ncbi:MarR family transcriptional regulator [Tsuneonella sp. HG222]